MASCYRNVNVNVNKLKHKVIMKNIRNKRSGRIFRIEKNKAKSIVSEGNWHYTTRGAMRSQMNSDKKAEGADRRARNVAKRNA
jgi:hypothetical protein